MSPGPAVKFCQKIFCGVANCSADTYNKNPVKIIKNSLEKFYNLNNADGLRAK